MPIINRKKKRDNREKKIQQTVETSVILNAIVIMHSSVKRIKHPQHGFCLRWANQEKKSNKKRWWNYFVPSLRNRNHILLLDEVGRRTVELIDGKKDLNTIADTIALEFHFDKEAAAAALIAFVIMLQKKNIILISEN